MNSRPLSYNQILWAVNETLSMTQASNLLRVSYNTFKKYAVQYGLFETNQPGKGIRKPKNIRIKRSDDSSFWNDKDSEVLKNNLLDSMNR